MTLINCRSTLEILTRLSAQQETSLNTACLTIEVFQISIQPRSRPYVTCDQNGNDGVVAH
jgi:hypothetical protein